METTRILISLCFVTVILAAGVVEEERDVENAVVRGDLEKLKVLLENRKDKNPVTYINTLGAGITVLHGAAYEGHANIIRWYHETLHFDDINPLDNLGTYTPMMYAAQRGKLSVVKYIEAVQDEKVWNRASNKSKIANRGIIPLHWAAREGHDDVAKFLLKHMTEKMPQDARGRTPLHWSASYGQVEVTKTLLNATGNSSSVITQHAFKELNYYTPIHEAAGEGHKTIVQIFLNRLSGNYNPKNKPGFQELGSVRPSDLALEFGFKDIADLILKKVKEGKDNDKCNYTCPPVKTSGIPVQSSCYQPDLIQDPIFQQTPFYVCASRRPLPRIKDQDELRHAKLASNQNSFEVKTPSEFTVSVVYDETKKKISCDTENKEWMNPCDISTRDSGPWTTLFCPITTIEVAKDQLFTNLYVDTASLDDNVAGLNCATPSNDESFYTDTMKRINSAAILIKAKERQATIDYSCTQTYVDQTAKFTFNCKVKDGNPQTQLIPEEATLLCKSSSDAESKMDNTKR